MWGWAWGGGGGQQSTSHGNMLLLEHTKEQSVGDRHCSWAAEAFRFFLKKYYVLFLKFCFYFYFSQVFAVTLITLLRTMAEQRRSGCVDLSI